jgi:hypothetical protein
MKAVKNIATAWIDSATFSEIPSNCQKKSAGGMKTLEEIGVGGDSGCYFACTEFIEVGNVLS